MQNILKPILIILGLVALGAVVYVYVIRQPETPAITRTSTNGVATDAAEQRNNVSNAVNVEEFQRLLMELNAIKLDASVFGSPQYVGLVDHTQTALMKLDQTKAIAPISKQNPFLGLDIAPVIILQGAATQPLTPRSR